MLMGAASAAAAAFAASAAASEGIVSAYSAERYKSDAGEGGEAATTATTRYADEREVSVEDSESVLSQGESQASHEGEKAESTPNAANELIGADIKAVPEAAEASGGRDARAGRDAMDFAGAGGKAVLEETKASGGRDARAGRDAMDAAEADRKAVGADGTLTTPPKSSRLKQAKSKAAQKIAPQPPPPTFVATSGLSSATTGASSSATQYTSATPVPPRPSVMATPSQSGSLPTRPLPPLPPPFSSVTMSQNNTSQMAASVPTHMQHATDSSPLTDDEPPLQPSTPDFGTQPLEFSRVSFPFQPQSFHFLSLALLLIGGGIFASMTLQVTAGVDTRTAILLVWRQVTKSVAFRQVVVISAAMLTVYQPLEMLLFIAALCTMADSFIPSLMGVPKATAAKVATVGKVVRTVLSTSFIVVSAGVMQNLKSRFCQEKAWESEMEGDATTQRKWEAYDKLGSTLITLISFSLGVQALGLEVKSVLAIGGIGGLAIGLAGREICENLFNGFLLMSTDPFGVGDEVLFYYQGRMVEGIVTDIGWYRTLIRSFEREVYVVPNAVFSKNVVLNVTRKHREWRFNESLQIRLQDVQKVNAILQDIRRIVRSDPRVISKLHRRVFLDKVDIHSCKITLSFYLDALNQDTYMAMKHDLLLAFLDCVMRNGATLAMPHSVLRFNNLYQEPGWNSMMTGMNGFTGGTGFGKAPNSTNTRPNSPTPVVTDPRIINLDNLQPTTTAQAGWRE
eukprot:gene11468-34184_t